MGISNVPDERKELASLAHQIRTPLASIRIMSELLAEQGEEAFDREHLKLVQNIYTCAIEIQDVIAKAVLDASSTERDE